MIPKPQRLRGRPVSILTGVAFVIFASLMARTVLPPTSSAGAASYVPVSGAGSTWSANAISNWIAAVKALGMRINYAATGSTDGRHQFLANTVDFAASDIPFQSHPEDGSPPELPAANTYAYVPVTAGGTTFMYNLLINGQRVTNLRLSGQNIAKIFTGQIVNWSDPAIKADNPQLALPNRPIIPVVRSDGSGSTAQFTLWMINQYPAIWRSYCNRTGRAGICGPTSFYPTVPGMIAQTGDLGVTQYVSQGFADGAIGYVQYSYALGAHFPVAKMLNAGGYYTEPTPDNVAVSLLKAQIDTTDSDPSLYLTQKLDQVYGDPDSRVYPLSSYSYMIIPTTIQGSFSTDKGRTLADFIYYAMCQGQQQMGLLGYSPMPINLVQASFNQITKIPGAVAQNINIQSCHNPTFSPDGTNLLATIDPMPPACDKQGPIQCATGTGGDRTPTQLLSAGGTPGSSASGRTVGSAGSAGNGLSASGSTGSGTSAAGGTAAGGTGAFGSAGSSASCDPTTGQCSSGDSGGPAGALASAGPNAYTLASQGASRTLLLALCGILGVALILAPGALGRYLRGRRR